MFTNLRYVNPQGGITGTVTETGIDMYFAPGEILHQLAEAGNLGEVAAYVEPPKPEIPPKFATAQEAIAELADWIDGFVAPLFDGTPKAEQLGFAPKGEAARAIEAGTATADQLAMIDEEAAITGETRDDLVALILTKAAAYETALGLMSGLRRKTTAALEAEQDPHRYEAILTAAQADANALALASPVLAVALGLSTD